MDFLKVEASSPGGVQTQKGVCTDWFTDPGERPCLDARATDLAFPATMKLSFHL
jgi:hypothetical protein